jgi:hypothetical protein
MRGNNVFEFIIHEMAHNREIPLHECLLSGLWASFVQTWTEFANFESKLALKIFENIKTMTL